MCNTETVSNSGCCCQPGDMHRGHGHNLGPKPHFPSKDEQLDMLKRYKQKLKKELGEVEEKIKDLE
ncbi:MAG: hypothetical protein ACQEP5_01230 [Actinomycetota bacterium]